MLETTRNLVSRMCSTDLMKPEVSRMCNLLECASHISSESNSIRKSQENEFNILDEKGIVIAWFPIVLINTNKNLILFSSLDTRLISHLFTWSENNRLPENLNYQVNTKKKKQMVKQSEFEWPYIYIYIYPCGHITIDRYILSCALADPLYWI